MEEEKNNNKPEAKTEVAAEAKTEAKPEVKAETKPEAKAEAKTNAPEGVPSENGKEKTEKKVSPAPASKDVPSNKGKEGKKEKKVNSDNIAPREYVVPMRREFLKAPEYRKSKKAVKALKQFLAKHMKVVDRDIKMVKVDIYLNNEIWHRGIRKPLPKIKVIAEKKDGIVYAKLAEVPEIVKFKMARDERRLNNVDKKAVEKVKKQEESESKIKEGRADKQNKKEEKEMGQQGVDAKELVQKGAAKLNKNKTSAKPNVADVSISGKKSLSQ